MQSHIHTYTFSICTCRHTCVVLRFSGLLFYGFTDLGCSAPSVHPLIVSTPWREGRQQKTTKTNGWEQKRRNNKNRNNTKRTGRAQLFRLAWSTASASLETMVFAWFKWFLGKQPLVTTTCWQEMIIKPYACFNDMAWKACGPEAVWSTPGRRLLLYDIHCFSMVRATFWSNAIG